MAPELSLLFPDPVHVVVRLHEDGDVTDAAPQPFISPLDAAAQQDLHWYLEVYPAHYTTEVDDIRAARIADQLPGWGTALFTTVFQRREAARLFNRFQDATEEGRLLTISSGHPSVLAQPWELLRDPTGTYLFLERPRISVRRRLVGAGGGRRPFQVQAKDRLHLLFVVSRPTDATFIDPRSDPEAVLDALEAEAPGRVTMEFLRPATLSHLLKRLEDERRPPVDILHFDGHGIYDPEAPLGEAARALVPAGLAHLLRQEAGGKGPQGYLLFEEADGTKAVILAALLGEVLHRQRVGLIVLSACQSAMVGGEDSMGSVAARLTHAGLPAVLAMTASVLVATTRALFGHFYSELARGRPIGTALDNARRALYLHPERGTRPRGEGRLTLMLQDWFVPALYQAGRDTALLTDTRITVSAPAHWGNLPAVQESGFHGRRRELWAIERAFVGGTRRLVVHGFGGQGKTALAEETGRWLYRTGMFTRVCFVGYANFQGVDPVELAVSTLATVLDRNLLDTDAATAALTETPTLLILDNLEALAPEPLLELLEVAVGWSEAGASRTLLTTRQHNLEHPGYPVQESNRCRYLRLEGLAPEDALAWGQVLMQLPPAPQVPPPARAPLLALFAKVAFHPLSIGVLARELKGRRIAELGERLETLLREADSPLWASLTLSLERLAPETQPWLPRLGVFQGGAFELQLLPIIEIPAAQWPALRRALEYTGLLQVEPVLGFASPFLRFHPTLAPALWSRLTPDEQVSLAARHRAYYHDMLAALHADGTQRVLAVRSVVRRELPNLLTAAHGALAAGEADAVEFASVLSQFLDSFGRTRDLGQLTARMQTTVRKAEVQAWVLATLAQGDQLLDAGHYSEAAALFRKVLTRLGKAPSYERCRVLNKLGGYYIRQARLWRAEALCRQALKVAAQLEPRLSVRGLIAHMQTTLGNVLRHRRDDARARAAYEAALASAEELKDLSQAGIIRSQLGALALEMGDLVEAERRQREALKTFQILQAPALEAESWHQLGGIYQEADRWSDAERAYREAARIEETLGNRATKTWHQLAQVYQLTGRPQEAEGWYRKALEGFRAVGDRPGEASTQHNLAALLQDQPGRLAEARALAEAALTIKKTLDPASVEIWMSYSILARIADKEGKSGEARALRQQSRSAWAAFRGTRRTLRSHTSLIAAVVTVAATSRHRAELEEALERRNERGEGLLVAALRRVLDGERDADVLCEPLNGMDAAIVQAVLRGIKDPEIVHALLQGIENPNMLWDLLEPTPEGEAPSGAPGGTPEANNRDSPVEQRPTQGKEMPMDPLTSIVTALVAGAAAGLNPTVAQVVKDGYSALKALIQRKYGQVNVGLLEQQPASESRRAVVKEDLAKTDAATDPELLQMAKALLDAVQRQVPDAAGAVGVDLNG